MVLGWFIDIQGEAEPAALFLCALQLGTVSMPCSQGAKVKTKAIAIWLKCAFSKEEVLSFGLKDECWFRCTLCKARSLSLGVNPALGAE